MTRWATIEDRVLAEPDVQRAEQRPGPRAARGGRSRRDRAPRAEATPSSSRIAAVARVDEDAVGQVDVGEPALAERRDPVVEAARELLAAGQVGAGDVRARPSTPSFSVPAT